MLCHQKIVRWKRAHQQDSRGDKSNGLIFFSTGFGMLTVVNPISRFSCLWWPTSISLQQKRYNDGWMGCVVGWWTWWWNKHWFYEACTDIRGSVNWVKYQICGVIQDLRTYCLQHEVGNLKKPLKRMVTHECLIDHGFKALKFKITVFIVHQPPHSSFLSAWWNTGTDFQHT